MTSSGYLKPELITTDTSQWFQNRKLTRQAVKWLTPKYCYATMTTDQILTTTVDTILDFDKFDTNDSRMNTTDWRITIPATGLYVIIADVWRTLLDDASYITINLKKNWTYNLWDDFIEYNVATLWYAPLQVDWSSNLWTTLLLQQWDYIEVEATYVLSWDFWNTSTIYKEPATQLRVISYILY